MFCYLQPTCINDVTCNLRIVFSILGESLMWVDKYKPHGIKQIIGQQGDKSNMRKLMNWIRNWAKNRKKTHPKSKMHFVEYAISHDKLNLFFNTMSVKLEYHFIIIISNIQALSGAVYIFFHFQVRSLAFPIFLHHYHSIQHIYMAFLHCVYILNPGMLT